MRLPFFRYHRDPIRSGSLTESNTRCKSCGEARGFIYTGPVYAEEGLENSICPWCIADGSAHARLGATFVDEAALPDDLPDGVVTEIARRTPGYNAWQSERWFSCCDDAMAFLEPAGLAELRDRYPQLEFSVRGNIIYDLHVSGGTANRILESLNRDSGPTAYVFQCLHCAAYRTFVDGVFLLAS